MKERGMFFLKEQCYFLVMVIGLLKQAEVADMVLVGCEGFPV